MPFAFTRARVAYISQSAACVFPDFVYFPFVVLGMGPSPLSTLSMLCAKLHPQLFIEWKANCPFLSSCWRSGASEMNLLWNDSGKTYPAISTLESCLENMGLCWNPFANLNFQALKQYSQPVNTQRPSQPSSWEKESKQERWSCLVPPLRVLSI